jgi:hypothetical protein
VPIAAGIARACRLPTISRSTVGGAEARILPLQQFFDGFAANPGAPEYWWAYALLFSTMIPSLINLMIGGASVGPLAHTPSGHPPLGSTKTAACGPRYAP